MISFSLPCVIIIIKDLKSVQDDSLDHPSLPARIPDVRRPHHPVPGCLAHQRRPKDDGQVRRRHLVVGAVVDDLVQMQHQVSEGGVIRIRELVDDRVQGVAAHDVVFDPGGCQE